MSKQLFSLLLSGLLLGASAAQAQTTAPAYDLDATHRYVQGTQLWPQVQGEFALNNGDYLLLALQGRRILDDNFAGLRSLGFDARQAVVGYENFGLRNPRWSWGATVRLAGDGGKLAVIPEVLLRHRSLIFGGITLGQRLSVERTFVGDATQLLESGPNGQFWGRLRVDAERLFYVSGSRATGVALRPRLSYEAATHLRLQKAINDPEERTIQFTSLRGEVGVRVSRVLDVTPWFAYQTRYRIDLPQGQYVGGVLIPSQGGKVNAVYPTFGIDLRVTLLPTGLTAERQQLPTQH